MLHKIKDGKPIPENVIPVSWRSRHEGLLEINRNSPVCQEQVNRAESRTESGRTDNIYVEEGCQKAPGTMYKSDSHILKAVIW